MNLTVSFQIVDRNKRDIWRPQTLHIHKCCIYRRLCQKHLKINTNQYFIFLFSWLSWFDLHQVRTPYLFVYVCVCVCVLYAFHRLCFIVSDTCVSHWPLTNRPRGLCAQSPGRKPPCSVKHRSAACCHTSCASCCVCQLLRIIYP